MRSLNRSSRILSAAILLFISLGVSAAQTGNQDKQKPPSGLSLEINTKEGPLGYQSVPGSFFGGRYRRISSWSPTTDYPQPRTIALDNQLEGEAVRVQVFALMDRFQEQKVQLGNFLLREGERAVVEAMTNYGYEPMEITVVRVRPTQPLIPTATSRVPAVEAVNVVARQTNFPSYNVTFRNLSAKDIIYMEVQSYRDDTPGIIQWPRGPENRPLIKAGEVAEISIAGESTGVRAYDAYTPASAQRIEVITVVFSDKTYEGNRHTAINFLALLRGQKIQLQRALPLLRAAQDALAEDPAREVLKSFEERVSALSRQVLQDMIETLVAEVRVTPAEANRFKSYMEGGLNQARKELLEDISRYRQAHPEGADAASLKNWLNNLRQKYEAWFSRL